MTPTPPNPLTGTRSTTTADRLADLSQTWSVTMNTNTLAAGVVGFLLGGLTVSIAAELENDDDPKPSHGSSTHESLER